MEGGWFFGPKLTEGGDFRLKGLEGGGGFRDPEGEVRIGSLGSLEVTQEEVTLPPQDQVTLPPLVYIFIYGAQNRPKKRRIFSWTLSVTNTFLMPGFRQALTTTATFFNNRALATVVLHSAC